MHVRFQNVLMSVVLFTLSFAFPVCTLAQTTTRISDGVGSAQGNDDSIGPKISADGRFVVFRSYATNLVAGDTNNEVDLFQKELATGITKRLNVATNGTQVTGAIFGYSVSSDGRYVVFSTSAPGLVVGDTNGFSDIFLRDTVNNTTTRISSGINNALTDGGSFYPTISSDGRYIAYESLAINLVAGDTNAIRDVFVYDRTMTTTTRLSVGISGAQANGQSYNAAISGDGSAIAFFSAATNLVTGDTNAVGDVFVRNIVAGTTTIVSVSTGGTFGDDISGTNDIAISQNGKVIAFDSIATNLVVGDTNARLDVFVRDITVSASPTTTRISIGTRGVQGNGISYLDVITPDGQSILFDSNSTNFVSDDTNNDFDVFLYNRTTGTAIRVSLGVGGVEGDNESSFADISADGSRLVFASFATNLVPDDTNGFIDIFLRTLTNASASLTGTLTLQGIAPTAPNQTLTFTFRTGGTDTVKTISVPRSGAFAIADLPRANYDVLISGGSYLSKRIAVDLSAGNVTLPAPVLVKTGDGTRDNAVDIADLLVLITAYNKISPAAGYNASVDFTLDGANDIGDLVLLIGNYRAIGDILP